MLNPPRLCIAIAPIDMRRGMDALCTHVIAALGQDAFDGAAYIFRNRAGTRIKVLVGDNQGVWLCMRRLNQGRFIWPSSGDTVCELSAEQFTWLTAGVDWQRLSNHMTKPAVLL